MALLERLSLTKSVVYEALRMEPPVKLDMEIESDDDARYKVKKGEMLFGYQPFATRDGKVFENSEEFVGEEAEKLLKYVLWSNGRETESSTEGNKQCPGQGLRGEAAGGGVVPQVRYHNLTADVGTLHFGAQVTVTSIA